MNSHQHPSTTPHPHPKRSQNSCPWGHHKYQTVQTPIIQMYKGTGSHGDRNVSEINRLVDYLCPETCKQYNWIDTKHISLSEECEYLPSREHHCFFLPSWWISSFGCILGKYQSIVYSSYLNIINLHISKLVDLRGLYKTLIWAYHSVSLSTLDFGIRYKTLTGKYLIKIQLPLCLPHKTLLMWKQSQRILQFKLVDTYIQLNVSFRRRNGLQSGCQQLRETFLLDGDLWFLSGINGKKQHFLSTEVHWKKNKTVGGF